MSENWGIFTKQCGINYAVRIHYLSKLHTKKMITRRGVLLMILKLLMNGGMYLYEIIFIFCVTFITHYEFILSVFNHANKAKG